MCEDGVELTVCVITIKEVVDAPVPIILYTDRMRSLHLLETINVDVHVNSSSKIKLWGLEVKFGDYGITDDKYKINQRRCWA